MSRPSDQIPHLLVVDDESGSRNLIRRSLEPIGYRCSLASTAQEALTRLFEEQFDLALVDIWMPGSDGRWLLRVMAEHFPRVVAIMMTGRPETRMAVNCLKWGALDFLIKPFSVQSLRDAVREALEQRDSRNRLEEGKRQVDAELEALRQEVNARKLRSIRALIYSLEAKDPYTKGHSLRVSRLSRMLAEGMGLEEDMMHRVQVAATVHDLGKIGVPEVILNKAAGLTDEEYRVIQEHPLISERILRPVVDDMTILGSVRHHHEQYGGGGYPEGLIGEEIPLGARILGVADAVDAMLSPRPYREAMSLEFAEQELVRCRGTQFDPTVAEVFLNRILPVLRETGTLPDDLDDDELERQSRAS